MLATLAQLKDSLGIAQDDHTKDTLLNSSLFQGNALVAGYIGYDVSAFNQDRTYTTILDNDRNHIQLPVWPVISVSSLSADGEALTVGNQDWRLDQSHGIIEENGRGWRGRGMTERYGTRITAVYRAGYNPVPDDLQMVCLNIAGGIFNAGGSLADTVSTGGTGELKSLTMFDAMSMSFDVGNSSSSDDSKSGPEKLLDAWAFILKGYRCKTPVMA